MHLNLLFLSMIFLFQRELKELVFLPFTALLLIFFLFLFFTLPETKGKSVDEITAILTKGKHSSGKDDTPPKSQYGSNDQSYTNDGFDAKTLPEAAVNHDNTQL